eukprot:5335834-Alexandrium_andersonii.AAC.1
MQHVSTFLCKEQARGRLSESCFADAVGRWLQDGIRKFHAHLRSPLGHGCAVHARAVGCGAGVE